MRVNHRRRDVGMAEQILHGSNIVTAAEQGRRERVAEGVRCGGLRDACLFYGTFEGALKGLVIHVMATHDTAPWIGRMRVLRKTPEPRPECPARGYFRSRASEAQRRCRPLEPVLHHARARDSCSRRLGALSGNIKARSGMPLPSRDDRAVIEIQILDPQLQTLTDPHFHTEAGRTNDARLPENRGCEPLHPGSAPPASAATAEVFRSLKPGQIRAQHRLP